MLTQSRVKALLDYDPIKGELRWKSRGVKSWDTRYAGTVAGWKAGRYFHVSLEGSNYLAHRVIYLWMSGELPEQVDHKNNNPFDNRWSNLRAADYAGNNKNASKRSDNTSGYKGVSFVKGNNKWRARINVNKRSIFLGLFDSPEDAYAAYVEAAKKHHGKFANFG